MQQLVICTCVRCPLALCLLQEYPLRDGGVSARFLKKLPKHHWFCEALSMAKEPPVSHAVKRLARKRIYSSCYWAVFAL